MPMSDKSRKALTGREKLTVAQKPNAAPSGFAPESPIMERSAKSSLSPISTAPASPAQIGPAEELRPNGARHAKKTRKAFIERPGRKSKRFMTFAARLIKVASKIKTALGPSVDKMTVNAARSHIPTAFCNPVVILRSFKKACRCPLNPFESWDP